MMYIHSRLYLVPGTSTTPHLRQYSKKCFQYYFREQPLGHSTVLNVPGTCTGTKYFNQVENIIIIYTWYIPAVPAALVFYHAPGS